jgi:hypothetical protein
MKILKLSIKSVVLSVVIISGILIFSLFKNTKTNIPRNPSMNIVGGSCDYSQFNGLCKIISITKTKDSIAQKEVMGGPKYEGFDIKFKIVSSNLSSNYSVFLNKEYLLNLSNSWYPGQKYLEKYKIKEGSQFNCQIKVITNGTCSPIIFDFENINTNDYFETD